MCVCVCVCVCVYFIVPDPGTAHTSELKSKG